MKTKKVLAALLSSAMVLGTMAVPVFAEGINTPDALDAALATAASGATITLDGDIDYSETYNVRNARDKDEEHKVNLKDCTLDLNGHTISTINGTVEFGGNGATIKNGTFDLKTTTDSKGKIVYGSYALIIDNDKLGYAATGSVAVKDVTLNGGFNIARATATLDNVTATTTPTLYYAVWAEDNAVLTINSGTFTDNQTPKGKGIISGDGVAKVYVNGGTFTGVNKLVYSAAAVVKISGGTFSHDPQKYLANGKAAVKVESGYKVQSVAADSLNTQLTSAAAGLADNEVCTAKSAVKENGKYDQVSAAITSGNESKKFHVVTSGRPKGFDITLQNILNGTVISGGNVICGLIITDIPTTDFVNITVASAE